MSIDIEDPRTREWLNGFRELFIDMTKRLDEIAGQNRNSREQARATSDGYKAVADALERGLDRGFRQLADAIRANSR